MTIATGWSVRKQLAAILAFFILFGVLGLAAANTSNAAHGGSSHHPNNYAGRPLSGDSSGAEHPNKIHCQIIAYGKVDDRPVAFTGFHCMKDKWGGETIWDHNGNPFGTTPDWQSHCSQENDLCFLWLLSENKFPANPHQVYAGRTQNGTALWTTISTTKGSSLYDCANLQDRMGAGVYAYRQNTISMGTNPRYSTIWAQANGCDIVTHHDTSGSYRWSGTPLMNCGASNTCSIIGGGWYHINGEAVFGNVREGMLDIHNFWDGISNQFGARFCVTAGC